MTTMIKTGPAHQMFSGTAEFLRTSFVKFGRFIKSQRSNRADNLEFRRLAARDDLYLCERSLSRRDMAWAYNSRIERMSQKNLGMISARSS